MPDQSSAADEHALLAEITAPLGNLPDDAVPIAADVDFPVVLRGYDRLAVDAYVQRTSQLVAELQATRSPEAAVRRALERVGEQISGVLQRAHDTSGQITAESRREAEDRLEVARDEALQITAAAEQRLKDLDVDTDRIWAERMRIVEDARQLARELMALADSAAERFPAAQDTGSFDREATAVTPGEMVDFTAGAESEAPGEPEADPTLEAVTEPKLDSSPASERDRADASADPDPTVVFEPIEPLASDEPREWPEPKPGS
jgi:hypothetical protein